jgi:phage baseplate assembly protein W
MVFMPEYGIAPALPMSISSRGGINSNKTSKANTRQQLRMLFLTSPGERVMNADYGIGIRRYLFEPQSITSVVKERITKQVSKYIPHITLTSLELVTVHEQMGILVAYSSAGSGGDSLVISSNRI